MDVGKQVVGVKFEMWARPGEHQTLDDLIARFGDRVVKVDRERNEILVSYTHVSQVV